jgi:DNA-binding transcriptional regulator YdaS (Cro superfamily)
MRDANSNTPAAGRGRWSERPGFSYEVRLVGGEAGRRLEREQTEVIAEVLRWVATSAGLASGGAQTVSRAGGGRVGPADPPSSAPRVGWPYGLEVRARAVGLVGVGRPVREVAGLVGVHPATVRRWVRQAVGRWADLADAVDTVNEHADPDPGAG